MRCMTTSNLTISAPPWDKRRATVRSTSSNLRHRDGYARLAYGPRLGSGVDAEALKARMPGGRTTVLTCGNADLMEDIKRICDKADFKFEMEEW